MCSRAVCDNLLEWLERNVSTVDGLSGNGELQPSVKPCDFESKVRKTDNAHTQENEIPDDHPSLDPLKPAAFQFVMFQRSPMFIDSKQSTRFFVAIV